MPLPKAGFPGSQRRPLAGWLITAMILLTVINGLFLAEADFDILWIAGICGWLAALLLALDTTKILRIQIAVIIAIGITTALYALSLGADVNFASIVTGNTELLTMVAAVGFLKLVALPDLPGSKSLPTGAKAYIQTLSGLSLTSAIINISSPILLADRIHSVRPLQRFTAQSMTRVFCGAACWSPFFAAMAVVLTYTKSASMSWLIVAGLPVTITGLVVVIVEARLRNRREMETFVGYPVHIESVIIPLLLACAVLAGSWLLSSAPVLVIIALSALFITVSILLKRSDLPGTVCQLKTYICDGLPRIVNELTLFLSAGVIAAGMSALIQQGIFSNPFDEFNARTASEVLGLMLIFSAIGIHPVIQISSMTPLLLSLEPDVNLLAITYLIAWSLGTCASPLSGTNLVFQGRYDIPAWKIAIWNWPYAITMYLLASGWLHLVEAFLI